MNLQKIILFGIILYVCSLKVFNMLYSIIEYTGLINNFSVVGYYIVILLSAILSILFLRFAFSKGIKYIDKPNFIYASAFLLLLLAVADQLIAYQFGLSIGRKDIDLNALSVPQNIRGQINTVLHILILLFYKWIFKEKNGTKL